MEPIFTSIATSYLIPQTFDIAFIVTRPGTGICEGICLFFGRLIVFSTIRAAFQDKDGGKSDSFDGRIFPSD